MIGLLRFRALLALTLMTNHTYRHFTPGRWIAIDLPPYVKVKDWEKIKKGSVRL
jgi:hypothetical protein